MSIRGGSARAASAVREKGTATGSANVVMCGSEKVVAATCRGADSLPERGRADIGRRSHGGGADGPSPPPYGVALRRAPLVEPGRRLAARLHAQLVEDVGDVALHGVRAEVERARDQLVAVAGGDETKHLELARAERFALAEQRRRQRARSRRLGGARGDLRSAAAEPGRPVAQR